MIKAWRCETYVVLSQSSVVLASAALLNDESAPAASETNPSRRLVTCPTLTHTNVIQSTL